MDRERIPAYPAVLIGGPPHAGKSVLAYSLTQALRRAGVEHYVLRAYPDGEGDWSNEAEPETVRAIRVKGEGTPDWIERICRDIAQRHLPLIVDVGGRPTRWQEAVFDHCTHAILLTRDAASREVWRERMVRHRVPLLADLRSALNVSPSLDATQPIVVGTLSDLHRGTTASGTPFDALVSRLAQLFDRPVDALRRAHLGAAPVEITVELDRLKHALGIGGDPQSETWEPVSLPQVLDYLPTGVPLALYGRAPNWLYAALALLAHPASLWQFDVRLGWVTPPTLRRGVSPVNAPLRVDVQATAAYALLHCSLPHSYVDYAEAGKARVPPLPPHRGVIVSGKLPHWLLTGITLAYRDAPWLAVCQPQIGGAVVVHSRCAAHTPGEVLSLPPPGQT